LSFLFVVIQKEYSDSKRLLNNFMQVKKNVAIYG